MTLVMGGGACSSSPHHHLGWSVLAPETLAGRSRSRWGSKPGLSLSGGLAWPACPSLELLFWGGAVKTHRSPYLDFSMALDQPPHPTHCHFSNPRPGPCYCSAALPPHGPHSLGITLLGAPRLFLQPQSTASDSLPAFRPRRRCGGVP